jgi:hypothetical protein
MTPSSCSTDSTSRSQSARRVFRSLSIPALAFLPTLLAGQGVTTAAVQGRIVGEDGSPILGARVQIVNLADGRRWEVVTRPDGAFLFEGVAVGSYRLEVRALGFGAANREGIVLALGERLVTDFTLDPAAIELSPVTVIGSREPLIDPGRTGPSEVIPRSTLAALPNVGRSFLNVALLSPQAAFSARTPAIATGSGIAYDGQNRVYNSFQIDGGVHHDLYRGQLPGRESFPRPLSLEAVEEIQILVSPFDVRHGGFAGGLANAVTRSGTNALHGSFFGYLADDALVRRGGVGGAIGDFTTLQFGGTVGGPIVRDRVHYFASIDVQRRVVPDPGPLISDTAGGADTARIGISYGDALRFRTILDTLHGFDAGSFGPVGTRTGSGRLRQGHGAASEEQSFGGKLSLRPRQSSGLPASNKGQLPAVVVRSTTAVHESRGSSRVDEPVSWPMVE